MYWQNTTQVSGVQLKATHMKRFSPLFRAHCGSHGVFVVAIVPVVIIVDFTVIVTPHRRQSSHLSRRHHLGSSPDFLALVSALTAFVGRRQTLQRAQCARQMNAQPASTGKKYICINVHRSGLYTGHSMTSTWQLSPDNKSNSHGSRRWNRRRSRINCCDGNRMGNDWCQLQLTLAHSASCRLFSLLFFILFSGSLLWSLPQKSSH